MRAQPGMGDNRTGMQAAPDELAAQMMEVTALTHPPQGGPESLSLARAEYQPDGQDGSDGTLGSIPLPRTAKGVVKAGVKALTGKKAHVLLDKLGERLAFERSGTRLYDAFIDKCAAAPDNGIVDVAQLRHFRDEEAHHFALVEQCIVHLGGDPTAQTPCADLAAVESTGLMQAVTDPRTPVVQSLHAMLVAELADNAAWEDLVTLAEKLGETDMAVQLRAADMREREHLDCLRGWHQTATLAQAQVGA